MKKGKIFFGLTAESAESDAGWVKRGKKLAWDARLVGERMNYESKTAPGAEAGGAIMNYESSLHGSFAFCRLSGSGGALPSWRGGESSWMWKCGDAERGFALFPVSQSGGNVHVSDLIGPVTSHPA